MAHTRGPASLLQGQTLTEASWQDAGWQAGGRPDDPA
jgi:hypothetical protein